MSEKKNDCPFCAGKMISSEYCGGGIKTMGMMLGAMFGGYDDDEEHTEAYNGIMLKHGNMLCFDNSAREYAELAIEIRHCPFCGSVLEHEEEEE